MRVKTESICLTRTDKDLTAKQTCRGFVTVLEPGRKTCLFTSLFLLAHPETCCLTIATLKPDNGKVEKEPPFRESLESRSMFGRGAIDAV